MLPRDLPIPEIPSFSSGPKVLDVILFIATIEKSGSLKYNDQLILQGLPTINSDEISVDWDRRPIPGTTQPIYIWMDTAQRNLSITIRFIAWDDFYRDVVAKVAWCRSLCYPEAGSTIVERNKLLSKSNNTTISQAIYSVSPWQPSIIHFVVGYLISFIGITTSFNVQWNLDAVDINTKYPAVADVSLAFESISLSDITSDMVKRGDVR